MKLRPCDFFDAVEKGLLRVNDAESSRLYACVKGEIQHRISPRIQNSGVDLMEHCYVLEQAPFESRKWMLIWRTGEYGRDGLVLINVLPDVWRMYKVLPEDVACVRRRIHLSLLAHFAVTHIGQTDDLVSVSGVYERDETCELTVESSLTGSFVYEFAQHRYTGTMLRKNPNLRSLAAHCERYSCEPDHDGYQINVPDCLIV